MYVWISPLTPFFFFPELPSPPLLPSRSTLTLTAAMKDTASPLPLSLFVITAAYLLQQISMSILFYCVLLYCRQFPLLVKGQGQQFRGGGARYYRQ